MTLTARMHSYEAARDVERCCIECYRTDCECKPSDQFPVIPDSKQSDINEHGKIVTVAICKRCFRGRDPDPKIECECQSQSTKPTIIMTQPEHLETARKIIMHNDGRGKTFIERLGDELIEQLQNKVDLNKASVGLGTTTNERGGKQAKLDTAFDCISPKALRILAECLQFGKAKYGKDNCYLIDLDDHLAHAMNHITQYQCGDRSELHLVNAMARVMFALHMSIDQGDTPEHYTHPDMVSNG